MFAQMFVQKALKLTWKSDTRPGWTHEFVKDNKASVTSLLIHDIFGGEILKTPNKNGWHFYNMIDGERIDFNKSEMGKSSKDIKFEDVPVTPDETFSYFDAEDYPAIFIKFINAYEATIGLAK
jgi:hypothetical protein